MSTPTPQPPYDPQFGSSPQPDYYSQPPSYPQPGQYPAAGYPSGGYTGSDYSGGSPATDPGKTMGIVGLILSFLGCLSIVGLIVSIVARRKSKKAGFSNGIALAGIIVGAIILVGTIIFSLTAGMGLWYVVQKCGELGPGEHVVNGVTFTCS